MIDLKWMVVVLVAMVMVVKVAEMTEYCTYQPDESNPPAKPDVALQYTAKTEYVQDATGLGGLNITLVMYNEWVYDAPRNRIALRTYNKYAKKLQLMDWNTKQLLIMRASKEAGKFEDCIVNTISEASVLFPPIFGTGSDLSPEHIPDPGVPLGIFNWTIAHYKGNYNRRSISSYRWEWCGLTEYETEMNTEKISMATYWSVPGWKLPIPSHENLSVPLGWEIIEWGKDVTDFHSTTSTNIMSFEPGLVDELAFLIPEDVYCPYMIPLAGHPFPDHSQEHFFSFSLEFRETDSKTFKWADTWYDFAKKLYRVDHDVALPGGDPRASSRASTITNTTTTTLLLDYNDGVAFEFVPGSPEECQVYLISRTPDDWSDLTGLTHLWGDTPDAFFGTNLTNYTYYGPGMDRFMETDGWRGLRSDWPPNALETNHSGMLWQWSFTNKNVTIITDFGDHIFVEKAVPVGVRITAQKDISTTEGAIPKGYSILYSLYDFEVSAAGKNVEFDGVRTFDAYQCYSPNWRDNLRFRLDEERDWDGGIDNDGLDISQLESYINDDNNDTMYFGDLQGGGVGGDVKPLGGGTPRDSPSRHHHHHHHHLHHHHTHSQHAALIHHPDLVHAGSYGAGDGGGGGGGGNERGPLSSHEDVRSRHAGVGCSLPIGCHNPYHSYDSYTGYRHHLPDSPPDSGSEPPYSPSDHPNLSPQQKVVGDIYSRPPGGGSSGGVVTFPYQVMAGHPPLPQQASPVHGALQPVAPLGYQAQTQQPQQHSVMMGGGSPLGGSSVGAPGSLGGTPVYGSQGMLGQGASLGEGPVTLGAAKKRKLTDGGGGMVDIKQEPDQGSQLGVSALKPCPEEDEYTMDSTGGGGPFLDGAYQCIRFQNFQQHTWCSLCDASLKELPPPTFRVDADKGFNFSNPDEAFVCQKKNHFQVTVHVQASGDPTFVRSPDGLKKVDRFLVHFFGVKTESPSQIIRVEQSQSDRSKKAFHPVQVDLKSEQTNKITVGRLHFSETTSNNMRKKGKPNPDQRYFYLVVALKAHCGDQTYTIAAHASEKIIVRASNPGQFESDVEYTFQRGSYPESIYHMGRVGINTDRPDEALVIHGNLKVTGQVMQPSDRRAKKDIAEVDTKEQLKNVQNLRVVKYAYREEFAEHAGMRAEEVYDTGVIAQEVKEVIPDAVKSTGDVTLYNGEKIENFLLVNKERIFMENVGAVKELCKVTGNLENRIGELEIMNKKISQLRRFESFKSTSSSVSTRTSATSRVSSVCHRSRSCSKRHKHMNSNHDDGICSNKTLQVTTIALVCIMAFCLMAMATIYILDYQDRRSENTSSSTVTTSTPITLSSSMSTSTLQPPTTRETLTSFTFTTTTKRFTTTTAASFPPRPPVLGKPENCLEPSPSEDPICDVYCCRPSIWTGVVSQVHPSPNNAATTITISRRIVPYVSTTVPPTVSQYGEVINNKLSTSDPNTVNDSTTPAAIRFKAIPIKKSSSLDHMAFLERQRARMHRPSDSRSFKRTLSKRSIPTKRSTHSQLRQRSTSEQRITVPMIEIVEFNTTINHMYCLNSMDPSEGCLGPDAMNYTYGLPISRFMPHTNLTLHFSFIVQQPTFCAINSTGPSLQPVRCSSSLDIPLPEVIQSPGPTPQDHYVVLTNVGLWWQVAYKFRISLVEGDVDPCNYERAEVGVKFYEINLIFQRNCNE